MDERHEIAGCSLSPPDLDGRRAAWAGLEPAVVDQGRIDGGFRVRFRREPGVTETVRSLVEAEEGCCGWASWRLADEGDGGLVLAVTGPSERIGSLAGAFGL